MFGVTDPVIDLRGGPAGFLLIHGLGGTPVELRYVADGLARAGHSVLCPLLTGHGGSEDLLNTTTWQDWFESIEAAHDDLKQRCEVVIVGGLSVGAVAALLLAHRRPAEVHATVLFSPTLWPNGWAIPKAMHLFKLIRLKRVANLFHLHERAPYGIKDERIRRFVLESLQSDGRPLEDIFGRIGGTVFEFKRMVDALKPDLGKIEQPALIFHARTDDQADLDNTFLLQRRLGGLVDVVVLDDSYHMVTLDRQRALVVERAASYVDWVTRRVQQGKRQDAVDGGLLRS